MKKSELRKEYIEKRKTLSQDEVLSLSEKIFLNFIGKFQPNQNQKVHCFVPIIDKNEVNTRPFLRYFLDHNIRVFVPKILQDKMISVEISRETTFIKSFWGITEPESNIDSGEKDFHYVITPLLYCDSQGNRVGYGKGFYDDFFKNINQNSLKIGVNFFSSKENIEDVWEEDIPLDYLVTPTEVLSFEGLASNSTK